MATPPDDLAGAIRGRLGEVRARVAAAAGRAGRPASDVRVVAVSKGHPPEILAAAIEAGAEDLGENYVQEMAEKIAALGRTLRARWHFVGRLQSNKARALARLEIALIHSIDSLEVARELDRRLDRKVEALIQVNIAGEATKAGVHPTRDLWPLLASLRSCERVRIVGLMTIPPPVPMTGGVHGAEEVRRYYRALRALRDVHRKDFPGLEHLSMGTSQDYEVAVEEGATLLRLGTAILGDRPAKRWRAEG